MAEEDDFEQDLESLLWIAAFLAVDNSVSLMDIDASPKRKEILRRLSAFISTYSEESAKAAVASWKREYASVLSAALRDGLTPDEAIRKMRESGAKMANSFRHFSHDNVMDAFRRGLAETGAAFGMSREEYVAMPDADSLCTPYAGVVYRTGEGPRPPIHPGCRCIRIPTSRG